jgi:hypothetical protein
MATPAQVARKLLSPASDLDFLTSELGLVPTTGLADAEHPAYPNDDSVLKKMLNLLKTRVTKLAFNS